MNCPKCGNELQPTGAVWGEGFGYACQGCGGEYNV